MDCTLEETAVLNYLREQPKATQKEIAAHIGKSEKTVKTITVHLVEKGIIERRNGKRNGFWKIKPGIQTAKPTYRFGEGIRFPPGRRSVRPDQKKRNQGISPTWPGNRRDG